MVEPATPAEQANQLRVALDLESSERSDVATLKSLATTFYTHLQVTRTRRCNPFAGRRRRRRSGKTTPRALGSKGRTRRILSSTAATASGRCRPSAFGIYTRRDGWGRFAPYGPGRVVGADCNCLESGAAQHHYRRNSFFRLCRQSVIGPSEGRSVVTWSLRKARILSEVAPEAIESVQQLADTGELS
jgi:hypothetical protein